MLIYMAKLIRIVVEAKQPGRRGRRAMLEHDDGNAPYETVASREQVEMIATNAGLDPDNPDHVAWEGGASIW
jgi:hypothetical protein